MKKRIIFNLFLGLGLLIVCQAIDFWYPGTWVHSMANVIIISMVFISILSEWITLKGVKSNNSNMVSYLLGAMVLRLILAIILFTIILLVTPENRLVLSINFLLVYLFFVVFDINASIANLRKFFRNGRNED